MCRRFLASPRVASPRVASPRVWPLLPHPHLNLPPSPPPAPPLEGEGRHLPPSPRLRGEGREGWLEGEDLHWSCVAHIFCKNAEISKPNNSTAASSDGSAIPSPSRGGLGWGWGWRGKSASACGSRTILRQPLVGCSYLSQNRSNPIQPLT